MEMLSDDQFANLIAQCIDELPGKYTDSLDNVVITYADNPTAEQRTKLRLRYHETLFGLYEGIPLTQRNAGYNLVLPDKITLFKEPLMHASANMPELKQHIKHTLWHEFAHFYGLDHSRIKALEQ